MENKQGNEMEIELKGMKFHCFHGYYTEEQSIGNDYEVDVLLKLKTDPQHLNDQLENTINYELIYDICNVQMSRPCKLIETLAGNILHQIQEKFESIHCVSVTIKKKSPFLGGLVEHAAVNVKS